MQLVYSQEQIAARVDELGKQIREEYKNLLKPGERLVAIGVLNGAFIFMADLIRAVGDLPVEVDFVRLSSYQDGYTSSAEVVMTKNLEKEIAGRHILVVEDIADCGLTLDWLVQFLQKRQPASIKVAVTIDKQARRANAITLDYIGFSTHDGFLVGYGLDYDEKYRNLAAIYEADVDVD